MENELTILEKKQLEEVKNNISTRYTRILTHSELDQLLYAIEENFKYSIKKAKESIKFNF